MMIVQKEFNWLMKDSVGILEIFLTNSEAPPYNHGLKTHFKWFKEHGVVEFVRPLMSDICNQDRLILPGVDIDIKLWPT